MTPLEEGAREDPRSFINRPYWARMAVVVAGPLFNYALAVALFFCVFGFFPPKLLNAQNQRCVARVCSS